MTVKLRTLYGTLYLKLSRDQWTWAVNLIISIRHIFDCDISYWNDMDNGHRTTGDVVSIKYDNPSTQRKPHRGNTCITRNRSEVQTLQWLHNERDSVSNHRPHDCLLNRLFRRRSKKTSKLHVTGLCDGNSPVTGEFPAQRASNVEILSISWRHHA